MTPYDTLLKKTLDDLFARYVARTKVSTALSPSKRFSDNRRKLARMVSHLLSQAETSSLDRVYCH